MYGMREQCERALGGRQEFEEGYEGQDQGYG